MTIRVTGRASPERLFSGLKTLEEARQALDPGHRCQAVERAPLPALAARPFGIWDPWSTYCAQALCYTLPNEIDLLGEVVNDLSAWHTVLGDLSDDDVLDWFVELVLPKAHYGLLLPNALQNRFLFLIHALTLELKHLCDSSSKQSGFNPRAQLPHAEKIWNTARSVVDVLDLEQSVNGIWPASKTRDHPVERFRDQFAHRIPPFIGRGVVELSEMQRTAPGYKILVSQWPALSLDEVACALASRHASCLKAYEHLHRLIEQQALVIEKACVR